MLNQPNIIYTYTPRMVQQDPATMSVEETEKGSLNTVPDKAASTNAPESEQDVEARPEHGESTVEDEKDPNVVDWDGPNDQANPMNWSDNQKWLNIVILSVMTMVT